jgi:hypothetical protein
MGAVTSKRATEPVAAQLPGIRGARAARCAIACVHAQRLAQARGGARVRRGARRRVAERGTIV